VFHSLDEKHIESIAKIQLEYLEKRLMAMEMKITFSPAALRELAAAGFDPLYGARPLKRAIQSQLENPLSKLILEGRFMAKDTILVNVTKSGVFSFEKDETSVV
jgi:ATP-dependent Clp protease ATP-binding subunit ClpB